MLQDAHTELDSEGEAPFITLGQLLWEGIPVRKLASAVEKYGIYTLDKFSRRVNSERGRIMKRALSLLEKQHKWEMDPESPIRSDPRSPLELRRGEYDDPYEGFGWPEDLLPDFDDIHWVQPEDEPKVYRKAPDSFVAAFIRLAVELAKKDPNFDTREMPGTKANLQVMADRFDRELQCNISTFGTYLKPLCTFKNGAKSSTYYWDNHYKICSRKILKRPSGTRST